MQKSALKSLLEFLGGLLPAALRESLAQWITRSVHEPDFMLFGMVSDLPGLVLDIGANRGHAAISILRRTRRMHVLSLEPNPAMRFALGLIRILHPWRFRFRLVGAGVRESRMELLVPMGARDLSSQASLDPAEFEKPYVKERLAADGHRGGDADFVRLGVQLVRVDDLGLKPDVIKLDVEGWEAQVIGGMQATLTSCKPMLIIEINNSPRWAPGLESLGYRFFTYEEGRLVNYADWAMVPGLNMICAHQDSASPVTRRLLDGSSQSNPEQSPVQP